MKRIIIIFILLLLIVIGYMYLYFNPIFVGKENVELNDCYWSNNLCNPIDNIDFTYGNNKIIIYTYWEDIQFLPNGVKQRSLLYCTDNTIIQQIKEHFEFERISNDYVGTTAANSKIYFFKANKIVFQSSLIFDENISIHFAQTGWVFSTKYDILKDNFAKFKPAYNPIIIL